MLVACLTALLVASACGSDDGPSPFELGADGSGVASGDPADDPTTSSADDANPGDDAAGEGDPPSNGSAAGEPRSPPIDPGELSGTDALDPSGSPVPPSGWVLYAARAEVTTGGGTLTFGGPHSQCGAIASADGQVVFTSNFQQGEVRNLAPHLGYADRGDGFAIWGLYIGEGGERGQEWSGTGQGTPTLTGMEGEFALIAPGGITFDPAGEGVEPDGRAFLLAADWSGTANENFTADESAASIQVRCLFVSTELVDILARALEGGG